MDKKERESLERKKCEAKIHMRTTYPIIQKLKKWLGDYYADYYRWKQRYEEADRALAEEDKLQVIESKKKKKEIENLIINLSKEQILDIAEQLGFEVEMGGGDN